MTKKMKAICIIGGVLTGVLTELAGVYWLVNRAWEAGRSNGLAYAALKHCITWEQYDELIKES